MAASEDEVQGGRDDAARDRAIAVYAANNSGLQSAAAQLQWSDIRIVTGAGAATVQTLYRTKANKINLWNYVHSDRSCPHIACRRDEPATPQYIFWECPGAKAAWADFGT